MTKKVDIPTFDIGSDTSKLCAVITQNSDWVTERRIPANLKVILGNAGFAARTHGNPWEWQEIIYPQPPHALFQIIAEVCGIRFNDLRSPEVLEGVAAPLCDLRLLELSWGLLKGKEPLDI